MPGGLTSRATGDIEITAMPEVVISELPGRSLLISDVAANDSDKSFTVPANYQYHILSVFVTLVTTATVGDRQMVVEAQTGAAALIGQQRAGAVQAASLTYYYQFSPSCADLTAMRDATYLSTPLPLLLLPATYVLRVYDNAAVDAAADDMSVQILVLREPV